MNETKVIEVLKTLEWQEVRYEYRPSEYFCPVCDRDKRQGHEPGCALAAALEKPVERKTSAMHAAVRKVLQYHGLVKGSDGVVEADLIYAVLDASSPPPLEPVAEYVVRTDSKGKTAGICYLRPAAYDLKEGSYLLYTSALPAKMLTVDEIRRIADKSDEGQEPAEFMLTFARGIEAAVLRGAGL